LPEIKKGVQEKSILIVMPWRGGEVPKAQRKEGRRERKGGEARKIAELG